MGVDHLGGGIFGNHEIHERHEKEQVWIESVAELIEPELKMKLRVRFFPIRVEDGARSL